MSDLISRQAILKHIEKKRQDALKMDDLREKSTIMNAMLLLEEAAINQPSAQPEIIRCKDCKHFEYDHLYIVQGIPVLGHELCNAWGDGCKTDENGWCFLGERKAKE